MGLSGFLTWLIEITTINESHYQISNSIIHVVKPIYSYKDSKIIYNLDNQQFYNDLIKVLTDIKIINKIDKIYIDLENSLHQLKDYLYTPINDSYKIIDLLIHYMFVLNIYNNNFSSNKTKMMLTIDDVPIEKTRDKLETDIYFRDRMFNVYNTLWTNELDTVDLSKFNVQINNDPVENMSLKDLFPTDDSRIRLNVFNNLKTQEKNNISLSKRGEGVHNIIKQIEDDIKNGIITKNILVDAPDADTIMLIFMSKTIMNAFLSNPEFNIYLIMNHTRDSYLFNIRKVIQQLFIDKLLYKETSYTYINPSTTFLLHSLINDNLYVYSLTFSILCLLTNKNDYNEINIIEPIYTEYNNIYTHNLFNSRDLIYNYINIFNLLMSDKFENILDNQLKKIYQINTNIDINKYIIVPNITLEKQKQRILLTDFQKYINKLTYKKFNNLDDFIKWLILYYSTNILNEHIIYQSDPSEIDLYFYKQNLLNICKKKFCLDTLSVKENKSTPQYGKSLDENKKSLSKRPYGGGISLNHKYKYYLSKYNLI